MILLTRKMQRESVEHLEEVLKYGEEVRAPNLLCVIDVEAGLSEGNLETLAGHAASSSNSSLVKASPAVGKKKYPSIDPCLSSKPKDQDDFDDDVNEMPISPTVEENEYLVNVEEAVNSIGIVQPTNKSFTFL